MKTDTAKSTGKMMIAVVHDDRVSAAVAHRCKLPAPAPPDVVRAVLESMLAEKVSELLAEYDKTKPGVTAPQPEKK